MSLRINNNVTALSTYANLNRTSNDLEASINKLSSGLRITKAADDAAGLAISEKMRRQIRGLNRAVLNAQDGVSMIQTAEGALSETQNIIQRMRELALQSANDTLTSNDRLEIQAEVEALKEQVNSIANSTEFNTKKLLNGNQAALVSTSSHSITGVVNENANTSGDYKLSLFTVKSGISQIQRSQIFTNKDTGALATGSTVIKDIAEFYDADGIFAVESTQTITINGNSRTTSIILDGQMTLNELAAQLQQAISSESGLGIANSKCSVISENVTGNVGDGGYLQIVSGVLGNIGDFAIAGSQPVMDSLGFAVTRNSLSNMISATIKDDFGNSKEIVTSNDRAVGLLEGIDLQFTSSPAQIAGNGGIVDGMKINSGTALAPASEKFDLTFTPIGGAAHTLTVSIPSGDWSLQGIARNINVQLKADAVGTSNMADLGFSASIQDGQVRITFTPTVPNQDSSFDVSNSVGDSLGLLQGHYNGFITGNKDASDVLRGMTRFIEGNAAADRVNLSVVDGTPTASVVNLYTTIVDDAAGNGRKTPDLVEINNWLSNTNNILVGNSTDIRVDEVNDSIVFTSELVGYHNNRGIKSMVSVDATASTDGVAAGVVVAGQNALKSLGFTSSIAYGSGDSDCHIHVVDTKPQFQIGADAGQNMQIGIGSMTCDALNISKIDMTSVAGAERSLEKLNQALDRVSAQRSQLGAYQNRLEYTISNLQNTNVNMSAAESRIRDLDIASEMTNYTRSQILAQAGNSMLTQANALPQNALALIQGI